MIRYISDETKNGVGTIYMVRRRSVAFCAKYFSMCQSAFKVDP